MAIDDVVMLDERSSSRFYESTTEDTQRHWNNLAFLHHHKRARDFEHDEDDDSNAVVQPARKRQRQGFTMTTVAGSAGVVTPPQDKPFSMDSATVSGNGWRAMSLFDRQVQPFIMDDSDDNEQGNLPSSQSRLNSFLQSIRVRESHPDDESSSVANDDYDSSEQADAVSTADPPLFFPIPNRRLRRPLRWGRIVLCFVGLLVWTGIVPLKHVVPSVTAHAAAVDHILRTPGRCDVSGLTLRQFLLDEAGFSLGMAPAFFGFYGYFGTLAAWEQAVAADLLQPPRLRQVAGASAGAMAAVLLAAGVSPLQAADFCANIRLQDFADFPGLLAVFRGEKFEQIMEDYLDQASRNSSSTLLLEDAKLPVAVTAFDLQTRAGHILTKGSMARAARASATFPFLFQPVGWTEEDDHGKAAYTLIDGGITDTAGVAGLMGRNPGRVVNLKISPFWGPPPPPSQIPGSTVVVSISIQNLPSPGPWAMELGPVAVDAASNAMKASLDVPLCNGSEDNHYELHIDASSFWKP